MDLLTSVLVEYDDTLIGKRKALTSFYFSYEKVGNMKLALDVMKYAFETYLKWTPYEIRDYLTLDVMDRLNVKCLLRYIDFPPELNPRVDLFFIAWKIYPQTIHYTKTHLVQRVYYNLLEKKLYKFPKEFFTGVTGVVRAQICLRYMIEEFIPFTTIENMYIFFGSPDGFSTLRKYRLISVCRDLFDTPVAFLHASLPREQRMEFLYRFYDFTTRRSQQLIQKETKNPQVKGGASV